MLLLYSSENITSTAPLSPPVLGEQKLILGGEGLKADPLAPPLLRFVIPQPHQPVIRGGNLLPIRDLP